MKKKVGRPAKNAATATKTTTNKKRNMGGSLNELRALQKENTILRKTFANYLLTGTEGNA